MNTVLCGFSYLEAALLIRESGGTYSYWYECYGRIPAFLVCWFWSVMDGPSGAAIVGLTFAQYVVRGRQKVYKKQVNRPAPQEESTIFDFSCSVLNL